MIRVNGRITGAHRVMWERTFGEIPEGMFVCHKCDVPSCVNPRHLFLATAGDNIRDAAKKGRMRRGEKNPLSKLCKKNVLAIRRRRRNGETLKSLADDFGVSIAAIWFAETGRNWRHV